MTEHKVIYKRCFMMIIILLAIYGAYTGGIKHKTTYNSKYESVDSKEIVPADNITFNNYDGDSSNTDKDNSTDKDISYEAFINIKIGSSYDDVKKLLGDGNIISSNEVSGIISNVYEWNGKGVRSITLTLQNGKVTSKSQVGLKKMDANITLDKYNTVANGMSYNDIKAILGDGQLINESDIMNNKSYVYSYINKDGSNANFTFDSNGLKMKSQYKLK